MGHQFRKWMNLWFQRENKLHQTPSHKRLLHWRNSMTASGFASVFETIWKIKLKYLSKRCCRHDNAAAIGTRIIPEPLKRKYIIQPERNPSSFSNYVPQKSHWAFYLDFRAPLGCRPGVNFITFILSVNVILLSSTVYFTDKKTSVQANRLLPLIYSFYSSRKWL